jgi:hypothetical protein
LIPPMTLLHTRRPNSTLLLTAFADQTSGKPHLLWPSHAIPPEFASISPDILTIHPCPSGWMTKSTFETIILEYLVNEIDRKRLSAKKPEAPCLLLCDGHSSRYNVSLWKKRREKNIHLLTFPSHVSHIAQV